MLFLSAGTVATRLTCLAEWILAGWRCAVLTFPVAVVVQTLAHIAGKLCYCFLRAAEAAEEMSCRHTLFALPTFLA